MAKREISVNERFIRTYFLFLLRAHLLMKYFFFGIRDCFAFWLRQTLPRYLATSLPRYLAIYKGPQYLPVIHHMPVLCLVIFSVNGRIQ